MKDLKISKDLLSEVLKRPVEIIDIGEFKYMIRNSTYFDKDQIGMLYRYLYGNEEIRFMSIYEFAFKCKEWAENKGYIIFSKNKECLVYSIDEVYDVIECLNQYEDYFEGNTEIEVILKACNWILEKEIQEENRLQLQEDLTEYNKLIKGGL